MECHPDERTAGITPVLETGADGIPPSTPFLLVFQVMETLRNSHVLN